MLGLAVSLVPHAATAGFIPSNLPGLQIWLDAGDVNADGVPDVLPNGTAVPIWYDRSGQGHRLVAWNNDPNYTPKVYSAGIGGRPVVRFDGSDYLWADNYDSNNPFTVFAVANMAGTQNNRLISSQNINWLMGYWGNWEGVLHADGWITDPSNPNSRTFSPPNTTPDLFAATNTGGPSYAFYKDGVNITRNATGGNDRIGRLGLGAWNSPTNEASQGDVAEIVMYDRVLSAAELNSVGYYLTKKYGLTTAYGPPAPANTLT